MNEWDGYKQIEHVGVCGRKERTGETLQLNLVSWYDRQPVYDLRRHSQDGKPMKGMTLTKSELLCLGDLIDMLRSE